MSEPIIIVKYNPQWPEQFKSERTAILDALGSLAITIDHIGSTAVPGLTAKPIIDIMVGIASLDNADDCIALLQKIGYTINPDHKDPFPERRSLDKKIDDLKIHLFLVEANSDFHERHLLFRNYLRQHPKTADDYNKLKKKLAKKFKDDRQAYNHGKAKFIKKVEDKAKRERQKYLS